MIIDAAPQLGKLIFPKRLWHMPREEKSIYLSFDDGPIPEVTPCVLEQLAKYEAKASFFLHRRKYRKTSRGIQKNHNPGPSRGQPHPQPFKRMENQ